MAAPVPTAVYLCSGLNETDKKTKREVQIRMQKITEA